LFEKAHKNRLNGSDGWYGVGEIAIALPVSRLLNIQLIELQK